MHLQCRIESGSFIVFLDRTEYGLVGWMYERLQYDTDIEMINCIEYGCDLVIILSSPFLQT